MTEKQDIAAGIVVALTHEYRVMPGKPQLWKLDRMPVKLARNKLERSVAVVQSGIGTENARHAASMLIEAGAVRLASSGVAGGLDPGLKSGDVVVATTVLSPRKGGSAYIMRCDDRLSDAMAQRLEAQGIEVRRGPVFTSASALCSVDEKRRLFRETGALVVDMEASGVAGAALGFGASLLVIKVVCDQADTSVPEMLADALRSDGSVNMLKIFKAILKRPSLSRRLIAMDREFSAATAALDRCWSVCVDLM